jgi:hypothetical protein
MSVNITEWEDCLYQTVNFIRKWKLMQFIPQNISWSSASTCGPKVSLMFFTNFNHIKNTLYFRSFIYCSLSVVIEIFWRYIIQCHINSIPTYLKCSLGDYSLYYVPFIIITGLVHIKQHRGCCGRQVNKCHSSSSVCNKFPRCRCKSHIASLVHFLIEIL